jgi:hypothetical protein
MSDDGDSVLLLSRRAGFVESVAPAGERGSLQSAYVGHGDHGVWAQLNAAENGIPAVIDDYEHPSGGSNDWLEADLSGDGLRAVLSTVQYGLIDESALPCRNKHPRHLYVWDCRP